MASFLWPRKKDEVLSNSQRLEIPDLDLHGRRRTALEAVNSVPMGLSHIRAVIMAGTEFFIDVYDLFRANFITTMIGLAYYNGHTIPTKVDTAIKLSTTAGAVIGYVLFGWLTDNLGRIFMCGLELIIILVGTFGQAITGY